MAAWQGRIPANPAEEQTQQRHLLRLHICDAPPPTMVEPSLVHESILHDEAALTTIRGEVVAEVE